MKVPAYQYLNARIAAQGLCIELQSLADFRKYLEARAQKIIFLVAPPEAGAGIAEGGADAVPGWFAIIHEGAVVRQSTLGFATLDDGEAAAKAAFPDAATFYAAQAAGYSTWADYELVARAGIRDREELDAMKGGGYIEGFERYTSLMAGDTPIADIGPPPETATALYRYAKEAGFGGFAELEEALLKGFRNATLRDIARARGFDNYADYEDAGRRGFLSYADYQFANERGLRNREDTEKYIDLEYAKGRDGDMPHDARVALIILSRLEQGKRISANKLSALLAGAVAEYKYADTGELPPWFTCSMPDAAALTAWLSSSDDARKYGLYDGDGEFFEVAKLQDRSVVIDGSNVAYNSAGTRRPEHKPELRHVQQLLRFLQSKGFREITIIADAALRHRLADGHLRAEIEEMATYIEAPAEKAADLFIIQYVKAHNCLLISNDTFREWKQQDPWVAANIDYYRLTFMIKGDDVLMPDLK